MVQTNYKNICNKQLCNHFESIVDEVFLIGSNMVMSACYTEVWNVGPFARNTFLFSEKYWGDSPYLPVSDFVLYVCMSHLDVELRCITVSFLVIVSIGNIFRKY